MPRVVKPLNPTQIKENARLHLSKIGRAQRKQIILEKRIKQLNMSLDVLKAEHQQLQKFIEDNSE